MIRLQKVIFQNIFSFGPVQEFTYDDEGLIQITGKNLDQESVVYEDGTLVEEANGSGKSSFVNIPYWILFGETIKKLNKDVIINDEYGKDCFGYLYLLVDGVNYKIARYRKHTEHKNSLFLYKEEGGDWVDISSTDIKKTQSDIDDLILINSDTFKKVILLAREDGSAFLELNNTGRGGIIENLIALGKFTKYSEKLKKRKTVLNKELREQTSDMNQLRGSVSTLKGLLSKKVTAQRERKTQLEQAGIADTETLNKYLSLSIEIEELRKSAEDAKKQRSDKNKELLRANNFIKEKKQLIAQNKTLYTSLEQKCSNCGHIEEEHEAQREELKELINGYIAEIKEKNSELEDIRYDVVFYQEQEDEFDTEFQKVTLELGGLNIDPEMLETSQINIQFTKDAYEAEFNEIADLRSEKFDAWAKARVAEEIVWATKKEISNIEFWLDVFNIKHENSIKQYIVSKIIPVFNQMLAERVDYIFDGNLSITFDEFFNDTIIKDGHHYVYHKLSTGEKNKLNLCINITIFELTRLNLNPVNVMFLDEIFTSIGEATIHKFMKFFQEKYSENFCIYIITHSEKVERNISPKQKIIIQKENKDSKIIYE